MLKEHMVHVTPENIPARPNVKKRKSSYIRVAHQWLVFLITYFCEKKKLLTFGLFYSFHTNWTSSLRTLLLYSAKLQLWRYNEMYKAGTSVFYKPNTLCWYSTKAWLLINLFFMIPGFFFLHYKIINTMTKAIYPAMYPTPLLGKFKITFSGARAHKVNSRDKAGATSDKSVLIASYFCFSFQASAPCKTLHRKSHMQHFKYPPL